MFHNAMGILPMRHLFGKWQGPTFEFKRGETRFQPYRLSEGKAALLISYADVPRNCEISCAGDFISRTNASSTLSMP